MDNIQHLQSLLNLVGVLVKKNNEILDATGVRFNVFNIIGLASDEVRLHSALLAELLRPNGSHGLNAELLKQFVETFNIKNFDCESAKVKVEKYIGEVTDQDGGRIDIIITDGDKNTIIIENKIYANDQNAQLIRYDNFAKNNHFNTYTILYLTLDGHPASKESAGFINYIPISFAVGILTWLEKCLAISVHQPFVRETINQYITLIKQLTNQDMSKSIKSEIVEIISRPEYIETAFEISNNINEAKKYIVEQFTKDVANKLDLKCEIIHDGDSIIFSEKEWLTDAGIWFAISGSKTYYSLKTPEARAGKATDLNSIGLFNLPASNFNSFGLSILKESHWSKDVELLKEMIGEKDFKTEIINVITDILKYIDNHEDIKKQLTEKI
jgi:hypothetical protein